MKNRLFLIVTSVVIGCVLMSGGYGLWEKKLTIRGSFTVVAPPPPPPPTPVPALSPSPTPVHEAGTPVPVTGLKPSPITDSTEESNQTDLNENNKTVETLPQSSDASVGESTETNDTNVVEGGDSDGTAQKSGNDTDTGAADAETAEQEDNLTVEE